MNKLQKTRPSDVRMKISQSLKNRGPKPQSVKDKISASMRKRWKELENQLDTDQNNTEISDIVL